LLQFLLLCVLILHLTIKRALLAQTESEGKHRNEDVRPPVSPQDFLAIGDGIHVSASPGIHWMRWRQLQ
jgi:hypothetical protein